MYKQLVELTGKSLVCPEDFSVDIRNHRLCLHCVQMNFWNCDVQAPSVSLCMSILNHHSDPDACGQLILTLCDDLSSILQPVAPGIPNLEVDYSLIIRSVISFWIHTGSKLCYLYHKENA